MYCTKCGKTLNSDARFCSGCGNRFQEESSQSQGFGGGVKETGGLQEQIVSGNVGFGSHQMSESQTMMNQPVPPMPTANPSDRGGIGWFLLGFFLSGLIAIILYFVWRREYPKRAKSILIGFVSAWILVIVLMVATQALADEGSGVFKSIASLLTSSR